MKIHSIQFKFLITVISAMLAVTLLIGGLSVYEIDRFVQNQTDDLTAATCSKEAAQINNLFDDMEKSVSIIASYVLDFVKTKEDITDRSKQNEIITQTEEMFGDVEKHTESVIAYYFRLNPLISTGTTGFFYSKINGGENYVRLEPTDLTLYNKADTEHVGWFWQPYENQKPTWLMPYQNHNNNTLMISYVVPLFYEDLFIGVVGMDFDYTFLTDLVHQIKIYEHGFAHLEINGIIVHHRDHNIGTETIPDSTEYMQISAELINGMTLVLSASYEEIGVARRSIALQILVTIIFLSILFAVIVIIMVRKIVEPLKKLTAASAKLSSGDYDIESVRSNTYEINLLSTAFENMAMRLREHQKLQHLLAYRDSLTGLRNTTSYKVWMTDFDKEIKEKQANFGVVVLDMNYLKEANDRYGHDVGNKLILTAAQTISDVFKRSPVFRIGGDEFLIILQNRDLAERDALLAKLDAECSKKYIETDNEKILVSVAKGLALYDPNKDTCFVDVFTRADDAMYKNKRNIKATNE